MRLKRLILIRENPEPDRTFGGLYHGSMMLCHTLEPGDADEKAPRVDPGWYLCEPHGWEPNAGVRYRETWALVGHDVSHFPEPGVKRAAILLHAGNRDEDTRGCIIVGKRRGMIGGETGLLDSRAAMNDLRELIGHNRFGLSIMGG